MNIVESEISRVVVSPQRPNYDVGNPILRVMRSVERVDLAAERENYVADSLQYILPYRDLALYSPAGGDSGIIDPRNQDNKNDFQKQNIVDFNLEDVYLVRGYATAGDWTGSFLQISYRGAGTELERASGGTMGPFIQAFVRVGPNQSTGLLRLPYNPATTRYEIELWGFNGTNLRDLLDMKGKAAIDSGRLVQRPDLVKGSIFAFTGQGFDAVREAGNRQPDPAPTKLFDREPDHTMHPIRPVHVELAFANESATAWDSRGGRNYHLEFNMLFRGWKNYLAVGISPNPHGGIGFLEYRNLLSNYFSYEAERRAGLGAAWQNELGRDLDTWNFDSNTWNYGEPGGGPKPSGPKRERFMAVDYMDLHLLQPDCGIGIHRHRDNQEVFFMLQGKGLMIVGDWCQFENRDRAFEIRTMVAGDLTICKTGQLHALFNSTDEVCSLFMFGGYD
jgi:mannose-6-phosphate isomerase-like protein (cupin superfamily)